MLTSDWFRIRLEEAERNARFKMNILEGQLKVKLFKNNYRY